MLSVNNLPINTIYRFDTNKYLRTTQLMETRGGKHKQDVPFKVTEVYEITQDGYIKLLASGKLTSEPGKRDNSREFQIFDYDTNNTKYFRITMYLHEVNLDELYELRDAVIRNKNRKKNH